MLKSDLFSLLVNHVTNNSDLPNKTQEITVGWRGKSGDVCGMELISQGDQLPGSGGNAPRPRQPDVCRKRHQALGVEGRATPQRAPDPERSSAPCRTGSRPSTAGRRNSTGFCA